MHVLRMSTFILLIGLIACRLNKAHISQLWFYTTLTGGAANHNSLMTPASFLSLKPDGTYTRDFGQFDYGAWRLVGEQISLVNQEHDTINLKVQYVTDNHMELALDNKVIADFDGFPTAGTALDPFSVANNRWRIAATKKETDAEIRQRLCNHCQFWETYFTWALKNDFSSVDVRSTPTLLTIYGNGFGLKPYAELPATWKFYFYDEEDSQKANRLMESAIHRHQITWASSGSKYEMFISAFHQLGQSFK